MFKVTMWLLVCGATLLGGGVQAQNQPRTITVVVKQGEQLGMLAEQYLKAPATAHWREVAALNQLAPPYTLHVGDKLLFPTRLLAAQSVSAKWLAVYGDVRVYPLGAADKLALVGDRLLEQERVVVGESASAVLALADGSHIKLLAGSHAVLDEHRYYVGKREPVSSGSNAFAGLLRLIQGSVEARAVSATDRAKPLRIQTPTSVVGVRGTEFRVSHAAAQPSEEVLTRSEVTEGVVLTQLDPERQSDVRAGFGIKLDPKSKGKLQPIPLLDAPSLEGWLLKHDRTVVVLGALGGLLNGRTTAGYRVQVALAEAKDVFDTIVFDKKFQVNEPIRIPNLKDGPWHIRVRGIDTVGLEGQTAQSTFVLKARPEPPLIQSPRPAEKRSQTDAIELKWLASGDAANDRVSYAVELTDPAGAKTVRLVKEPTAVFRDLVPGPYAWRVATQLTTQVTAQEAASFDRGPWSDVQTFTVVASAAKPESKLDSQARTLTLSWADQKAAKYILQMDRDGSFDAANPQRMQVELAQPNVTLTHPAVGKHFVRYRAVEADGFQGGWSSTMTVDIPPNWQDLLRYLGGGSAQWP